MQAAVNHYCLTATGNACTYRVTSTRPRKCGGGRAGACGKSSSGRASQPEAAPAAAGRRQRRDLSPGSQATRARPRAGPDSGNPFQGPVARSAPALDASPAARPGCQVAPRLPALGTPNPGTAGSSRSGRSPSKAAFRSLGFDRSRGHPVLPSPQGLQGWPKPSCGSTCPIYLASQGFAQ